MRNICERIMNKTIIVLSHDLIKIPKHRIEFMEERSVDVR